MKKILILKTYFCNGREIRAGSVYSQSEIIDDIDYLVKKFPDIFTLYKEIKDSIGFRPINYMWTKVNIDPFGNNASQSIDYQLNIVR